MAKTTIHQTSFASGELTPFIQGRIDREIYYNGADKLRNVRVTPVGGAIRREGTKYIDTTTGNVAARLISFQFNVVQTYLLVFTAGEFKVYKDGVLQATVSSAPIDGLTATIIQEINFTQSADTLILVHPDINPIRITRTSDTAWTAANITLSNIPTFNFGSGNEAVWSSTRGWPRSVTFWQQRLWFGGSKSRPQTVWGSKLAGFFDFGLGTGLDAEGIEITIDDDEVNAIVNIFASRTLQIFTTGGEFFTPISLASALTPKTARIEKATRHGSNAARPISNDGATVFIERGGQVVREYVFLDVEQSYITEDISFLSAHLILNPIRVAIQRSTILSGEYSYYVNSDGTMAVLNRRRSQSFLAWTLFETEGFYEDVAVLDNDVYVVVRRVIDGNTVRYIEKFDNDYYTDAGKILTSGSPTTSWTGLSHLEDASVNVRSQVGYPMLANTVSSGGITTETAQTSIEVGLKFTPRIKILPPDVAGKLVMSGEKRRIASINFNLNQSNGFNVATDKSSYRVALNSLGNITFNQPLQKFTGWHRMYCQGISRQPYVEITQNNPNDLHILSMATEVTL